MAFAQDVALVFALLSGAVLAGCGASSGPDAQTPSSIRPDDSARASDLRADGSLKMASDSASEPVRDVRAIHKSRCGNCHVRVEPGTRTKAQLEAAFTRHHTRVKMNDSEWAMMVDYLASDSARTQASLISAEK